jgi:Kef-type K+ transport system membrane component KefB
MSNYAGLVVLGSLAVLAFLWDLLSRRTGIPSVLFLLGTGMAMRTAAPALGFEVGDFNDLLQVLGSVGLVFIVFEGSLDLELSRERLPLITRALVAAFAILLLTAWAIAAIYHFQLHLPWQQVWLNAAPLAVISSSVAISSARDLDTHRREFVIYESTFSDILGIFLFNFLLANHTIHAGAFVGLSLDTLYVLLISAAATAALLYLVAKTQSTSKYTLLFALLVLAYAIGKMAHLPTLLLIFVLGISLNNARLLPLPGLRNGSAARRLRHELRVLKRFTGEGAFLLRTYFFALFGFSIDLHTLASMKTLVTGLLILATLTFVRAAFLYAQLRRPPFPEAFMAPRGLITVLLFYSIPADQLIPVVGRDVILVVILGSTLLMTGGLQWHRRRASTRVEAGDPHALLAQENSRALV